MSIKTVGWPVHDENECRAVHDVLVSGRTNYWTGNLCLDFEKEYAAFTGTRFAVALMNGTVALEAALYALGIGPGDEVITSCRTFIASASCIVMCGATPVLADVDENSQNITAATILPCITPKTKAIIVVHLAGWPADMDAILALADQYQLKVIEDCAQAHGAQYKGKTVGSLGHVAAFSFCQDKIITTGGEGGMITTDDETLWRKIWSLKDHGKNHGKVYQEQPVIGFRWVHDMFGTNWRMTEIQAAIGLQQLKKLPEWLRIRTRNADILNEAFQHHHALRLTIPPSDIVHAYYKYYVFIRPEYLKPEWNRDRIMQEVNQRGVPCFAGICSEIYLESAFKEANMHLAERKPVAKSLGETSLMLLVHPTLNDADMKHTAKTVLDVLSLAAV